MEFEFYVFHSVDRPGHYYGNGYNEEGFTVYTRMYKTLANVKRAQANNWPLMPKHNQYVPMKMRVEILGVESVEI